MTAVVEKQFVWRFVDEVSAGLRQAQSLMEQTLEVFRSAGAIANESANGLNVFGDDAKSSAEKVNEAMNKCQSDINKVKESVNGLPKDKNVDIETKANISGVKEAENEINKIPKEKNTEINAKANDSAVNKFKEEVNTTPKERITNLLAKISGNGTNSFKRNVEDIPEEHTTTLKANTTDETKVKSFGETLKGTALGMGIYNVAMQAGTAISNQFAGAISRYDTLNNYPKILESMGISANDASASMKTLKQGVDGLPTSLDEVAKTAQRLIPMSKNADDASKSALALNDAFLASGASSEDASRGLEQYTQMLSSGKVDMQSWRTLEETMPASLRKVSQSFGIAGGSVQELYQQLKSGKISMQELNQHFQQLDQGVNGFHQTALNATGGIGTAFRNMGNRVKAAIADAMGGFDKFVQKTTGKTIAGNINDLSSHFTDFGKKVGNAFSDAGNATKPFGAILSIVAMNIAATVNGAKSLLSGFASAFKANFIAPGEDAKKSINDLKESFGKFNAAIIPIIAQIGSLMGILSANAFRLIGDAIKAIVGSFTNLGTAIKGTDLQAFHKTLTDIGIGFNQAVVAVEPFIVSLGKIIGIMANGAFRAFTIILHGVASAISIVASQFAKLDGSGNSAKKLGHSLDSISANKGKLEALGKVIGTVGTAILAMKATTGTITKVSKGISDLGSKYKAMSKAFMGKKFVSTFISSLKNGEGAVNSFKKAFQGLNAVTKANIFGAIIAAIATLTIAFIELYRHNAKFRKFVNGIVSDVKSFAKKFVKGFKDAFDNVGKFFKGQTKWQKSLNKNLNNIGKSIGKTVKGWGKDFQNGFNSIAKTFSKWGSDIGKITQKAINGVKNFISSGLSGISHFWNSTWNGISSFFQSIWNGIVHFIKWYINMCSNAIRTEMNTINKIWKTIWNAIKELVITIWNGIKNAVSSAINFVRNVISNTLKVIQSIWNGIWNAISSFFSGIWNGIKNMASASINWIHDTISSVLDKISSAWHSMWRGLSSFFGSIWKDIKQFAQDGINGVLHVINAGIDGIDAVWKFFTGHETSIHHLKPVHFSQGGIVDRHLSMVNDGAGSDWKELIETPSGELMMSNERNAVLPLEPGTRVYNGEETRSIMNALGVEHYATGGIVGDDGLKHYKDGGVVGDLIDWGHHELSNLGSWIKDKWDAITKFLKHPLENTKEIIAKAITDPLGKLSNSNMVELGKGVFDKLTQPISDWFKKGLQDLKNKHDQEVEHGKGYFNGGAGVERWAPVIDKVAQEMGVHLTDDQKNRLLRQIATESGGNELITQQISDVNSAAGHPAQGLLQFIPSTFAHWALPGHTNINSGYDQIMAAINCLNHGGEGGWGNVGDGHGWATGGHITGLDLAWISDNPEHEEFVINPFAPSARPLLKQAMDRTQSVQPVSQTDVSNSDSDNQIGERIVELLELILQKDSYVNLEDAGQRLRSNDAQSLRMVNMQRGV